MVITVYLSEHGKVSAALVTQTRRWDTPDLCMDSARGPCPIARRERSCALGLTWHRCRTRSQPGVCAVPAELPRPCGAGTRSCCRGGWGAAELWPRDGCSPRRRLLFQAQPGAGVTSQAPVATVRPSSIGTWGGARDGSASSRRHRESIHQCLHTAKIEIKGPLSSFSLVCVSPRGGGNYPSLPAVVCSPRCLGCVPQRLVCRVN